MSAACSSTYLPQDTAFWALYSTLQSVAHKAQNVEPTTQQLVVSTAPPMDNFDLITMFLWEQIRQEWPKDELDRMNKMWSQITGFEMSATVNSDSNIHELIQVLQFREAGLVRMYSDSGCCGTTISRPEMMKLHTKFFDDYGCRITDFSTNESFLFIVETHIQSQFA